MAFQQEQGFSTDTFICGQKNLGVQTRVSGCGTSVHTVYMSSRSIIYAPPYFLGDNKRDHSPIVNDFPLEFKFSLKR